jgi:hypothetical protein
MQVLHESPENSIDQLREQKQIQRNRILQVLAAAHGDWVPLPQIATLAAQYNARIFELRHLGHVIKNKTEVLAGVRHSWYRLIPVQHSEAL